MSRYFIVREKESGRLTEIIADTPEKAVNFMSKAYKKEYEIIVELTKEEWEKSSKGEPVTIPYERINGEI